MDPNNRKPMSMHSTQDRRSFGPRLNNGPFRPSYLPPQGYGSPTQNFYNPNRWSNGPPQHQNFFSPPGQYGHYRPPINNYYQPPRPHHGNFRQFNNFSNDRRSGNFQKQPNNNQQTHAKNKSENNRPNFSYRDPRTQNKENNMQSGNVDVKTKDDKVEKKIESDNLMQNVEGDSKNQSNVENKTQIESFENKMQNNAQNKTQNDNLKNKTLVEAHHANSNKETNTQIIEKEGINTPIENLLINKFENQQVDTTLNENKTTINSLFNENDCINTPIENILENNSENDSNLNENLGLNEWLVQKGKDTLSFQHLKLYDEDNKENYEDKKLAQKSESWEALNIIVDKPEQESNLEKSTPLQALEDLHKLILEGYPAEKCQIWLNKIQEKDSNISEEPLFWECKAAVERDSGNFGKAVECYKTAIVKGAEVESVDESLDHLMKTFDLLEINPESETASTSKKTSRKSVVNDFCDVLKTSVIQFAVTQRSLKKEGGDKEFVVTPVRRSSRLTAKSSTPGVKICASLEEVDESVKKNMNFKGNKLLL